MDKTSQHCQRCQAEIDDRAKTELADAARRQQEQRVAHASGFMTGAELFASLSDQTSSWGVGWRDRIFGPIEKRHFAMQNYVLPVEMPSDGWHGKKRFSSEVIVGEQGHVAWVQDSVKGSLRKQHVKGKWGPSAVLPAELKAAIIKARLK